MRTHFLLAFLLLPALVTAQSASDIYDRNRLSQEIYGFELEKYRYVTNRSGEQIALDIYWPTDPQTGERITGCNSDESACQNPRPVVLEMSAYRSWSTPEPTKPPDNARQKWARRGYVYVFSDVPGAGGSEGSWDLFSDHEQVSGADVVRWIDDRAWSAKIGMLGGSYPAIETMLVAGKLAEESDQRLDALAPGNTLNDLYLDGLFVGGMRRGEDFLALGAAFKGLAYWSLPYFVPQSPEQAMFQAAVAASRLRQDPYPFTQKFDEHPADGELYRLRSVYRNAAKIDVPTALTGGHYDIFTRGMWQNYLQTGAVPGVKRITMGPFTHVPLYNPAGDAFVEVFPGLDLEHTHRWFDQWLLDTDTDAEENPPILLYVDGTDDPLAWRYECKWPLTRTRYTSYFLVGANSGSNPTAAFDGSLVREDEPRPEGEASYVYDPAEGVTGGRWFARGSVAGGSLAPYDYYLFFDNPQDQTVEETYRVTFSTPAIEEDLEVVGPITATLHASTTAFDTDWVVRLIDVSDGKHPKDPLEGHGHLITTGWLKGTHMVPDGSGGYVVSHADPQPILPGAIVPYEIEIWPTSYRFKAGHRVRIDISSADFPKFAPNPHPAENTIHFGAGHPSRIQLPVIPPDSETTHTPPKKIEECL